MAGCGLRLSVAIAPAHGCDHWAHETHSPRPHQAETHQALSADHWLATLACLAAPSDAGALGRDAVVHAAHALSVPCTFLHHAPDVEWAHRLASGARALILTADRFDALLLCGPDALVAPLASIARASTPATSSAALTADVFSAASLAAHLRLTPCALPLLAFLSGGTSGCAPHGPLWATIHLHEHLGIKRASTPSAPSTPSSAPIAPIAQHGGQDADPTIADIAAYLAKNSTPFLTTRKEWLALVQTHPFLSGLFVRFLAALHPDSVYAAPKDCRMAETQRRIRAGRLPSSVWPLVVARRSICTDGDVSAALAHLRHALYSLCQPRFPVVEMQAGPAPLAPRPIPAPAHDFTALLKSSDPSALDPAARLKAVLTCLGLNPTKTYPLTEDGDIKDSDTATAALLTKIPPLAVLLLRSLTVAFATSPLAFAHQFRPCDVEIILATLVASFAVSNDGVSLPDHGFVDLLKGAPLGEGHCVFLKKLWTRALRHALDIAQIVSFQTPPNTLPPHPRYLFNETAYHISYLIMQSIDIPTSPLVQQIEAQAPNIKRLAGFITEIDSPKSQQSPALTPGKQDHKRGKLQALKQQQIDFVRSHQHSQRHTPPGQTTSFATASPELNESKIKSNLALNKVSEIETEAASSPKTAIGTHFMSRDKENSKLPTYDNTPQITTRHNDNQPEIVSSSSPTLASDTPPQSSQSVKPVAETAALKKPMYDLSSFLEALPTLNLTNIKPTSSSAPQQVLPIEASRESILQYMSENRLTVIHGETGCGKSSMIPVYVYQDAIARGIKPNIFITQPRRLAVQSLSARVAKLLNTEVGGKVGYRMSLVKNISPETCITYVTAGYLLQYVTGNPAMLKSLTHLILDEVHERDIDHDLLCLVIKLTMEKAPNLQLIIMSATLQSGLFAKYFTPTGLQIPESIFVGAKTHPVYEIFMDDLASASFPLITQQGRKIAQDICNVFFSKSSKGPSENMHLFNQQNMPVLHKLVLNVLEKIVSPGICILIFLPGIHEISEMEDFLASNTRSLPCPLHVIILHSLCAGEDQELALEPPPPGSCKIVIATNIAESSITIPDAIYVIDFGVRKELKYDADMGISRLELIWCSRASIKQRGGRVGRIRPGVAIRLFSKKWFQTTMLEFDPAEIHRGNLDVLVLRTKTQLSQYGSVRYLMSQLCEVPSQKSVDNSFKNLYRLGATKSEDENAKVTRIGHLCVHLPVDVRVTRLLFLFLAMGYPCDGVMICSAISISDPFIKPLSLLYKNYGLYAKKLLGGFDSRSFYDEQQYSELIMYRNMILDYLRSSSAKSFAYDSSVSQVRLKQIIAKAREICSTLCNFAKTSLKDGEAQLTVHSLESFSKCLRDGIKRADETLFCPDYNTLKSVIFSAFHMDALVSKTKEKNTEHKDWEIAIKKTPPNVPGQLIREIIKDVVKELDVDSSKQICIIKPTVITKPKGKTAVLNDCPAPMKRLLQFADRNRRLTLPVPYHLLQSLGQEYHKGVVNERGLEIGHIKVNYSAITWIPFFCNLASVSADRLTPLHLAYDIGRQTSVLAVPVSIIGSSSDKNARANAMTVIHPVYGGLMMLMHFNPTQMQLEVDETGKVCTGVFNNKAYITLLPYYLDEEGFGLLQTYRKTFAETLFNTETKLDFSLNKAYVDLVNHFTRTPQSGTNVKISKKRAVLSPIDEDHPEGPFQISAKQPKKVALDMDSLMDIEISSIIQGGGFSIESGILLKQLASSRLIRILHLIAQRVFSSKLVIQSRKQGNPKGVALGIESTELFVVMPHENLNPPDIQSAILSLALDTHDFLQLSARPAESIPSHEVVTDLIEFIEFFDADDGHRDSHGKDKVGKTKKSQKGPNGDKKTHKGNIKGDRKGHTKGHQKAHGKSKDANMQNFPGKPVSLKQLARAKKQIFTQLAKAMLDRIQTLKLPLPTFVESPYHGSHVYLRMEFPYDHIEHEDNKPEKAYRALLKKLKRSLKDKVERAKITSKIASSQSPGAPQETPESVAMWSPPQGGNVEKGKKPGDQRKGVVSAKKTTKPSTKEEIVTTGYSAKTPGGTNSRDNENEDEDVDFDFLDTDEEDIDLTDESESEGSESESENESENESSDDEASESDESDESELEGDEIECDDIAEFEFPDPFAAENSATAPDAPTESADEDPATTPENTPREF